MHNLKQKHQDLFPNTEVRVTNRKNTSASTRRSNALKQARKQVCFCELLGGEELEMTEKREEE